MCGTLEYFPNEMVKRRDYTCAVDMWCVGVLAFELVHGKAPFTGANDKATRRNIKRVAYSLPDHFSAELGDFV